MHFEDEEELMYQLRTKSIVKIDYSATWTGLDEDGLRRQRDGAWILQNIARRLGISNVSEFTKHSLYLKIINHPNINSLIKKSIPEEQEGISITRVGEGFKPYGIQIYFNNAKAEQKFKDAIEDATESLCSDADFILKPIRDLLGM